MNSKSMGPQEQNSQTLRQKEKAKHGAANIKRCVQIQRRKLSSQKSEG